MNNLYHYVVSVPGASAHIGSVWFSLSWIQYHSFPETECV